MRIYPSSALGILLLSFSACSETSAPPHTTIATERHPSFSVPLGEGNTWNYSGIAPILRSETPLGAQPTQAEIRFIDTLQDEGSTGSYTIYRANIATQVGMSYGVAYDARQERIVSATVVAEQGRTFFRWHPESFSASTQPRLGDTLHLSSISYLCSAADTTVAVEGNTYTGVAIYSGFDTYAHAPLPAESVWLKPGVGIVQWRHDGSESNLLSYNVK